MSELSIPEGASFDSVSEDELRRFLSDEGRKRGAAYSVTGLIEKEGNLYHLTCLVVDTESGSMLLKERKTAVGIGDLDRIVQGISARFVSEEFGEKEAEKMVNQRATGAPVVIPAPGEEGDRLSDLEELAEKNPDEAVEKLPENVKNAVKEEVKEDARKEVEEEEIEKLYEEERLQEKERKRKRNLKIAFISSYSLLLTGDILSDFGVQSRMVSLRAWSHYMNRNDGDDYFEEYEQFHERAQSSSGTGTIIEGVSQGALSFMYFRYTADHWSLSPVGKKVLAWSSGLYTLGQTAECASGLLGYRSLDFYDKYFVETDPDKIQDDYDAYRESHTWYEVTRYASYGLKLLGAGGAITAFTFLRGDEPLAAEKGERRLLGFSNLLSGTAAVSAHLALNTYARSVEGSISSRSNNSISDADPKSLYNGYAIGFGSAAAGLYAAAIVTEYLGLTRGDGGGASRTARASGKQTGNADRSSEGVGSDGLERVGWFFRGEPDLSMAFFPYTEGVTLNFTLRGLGR